MADDDAVSQFMSVTGASKEDAAFYLSSAAGNVETAVDSFFSTGGDQAAIEDDEPMEAEADEPGAPPSVLATAAMSAVLPCKSISVVAGIGPAGTRPRTQRQTFIGARLRSLTSPMVDL